MSLTPAQPGALAPRAMHPWSSPRSHPSPPAPSSPGHSPCGVASAADAAFVSPTSICHGIASGRCYTNPELSSCSPSAPSSCGHKRGKGSQRQGGKRMETKARWIFPGPSQIYSTKNTYTLALSRGEMESQQTRFSALRKQSSFRVLAYFFELKIA